MRCQPWFCFVFFFQAEDGIRDGTVTGVQTCALPIWRRRRRRSARRFEKGGLNGLGLHADSARNRLIGIGLMSVTYVLFTLLDGSAKWLVGSVPVIVVVWLRFATHAVFASALLLPVRGRALVQTSHLRWH